MIKYFIPILFVTTLSFAQDHHFKAERKEVTWVAEFVTNETNILELIDKNHTKVVVNKEDNTGKGVNLNCDCKDGGWYFEQSFDLNFTVEIASDKYIITVSDIVFDGEGENNTNNRLENYVLKLGQSNFHTTKKNLINLNCLENYFIKLFKIQNATIAK
jgi:hypothetical protein